ncbi:MAG: hypothetical protein LVS60_16195 [Nodosilinea sp. LVE1205-7]|jgi:hypothetical protein
MGFSFLPRSSFKRLLLIISLGTLVVMVVRFATAVLTSPPPAPAQAFRPLSQPGAQAQVIETGIYANHLYDVNVASNTYYLDAYIWFKWNGKIDPVENLELTNAVEAWGLTKTVLQAENSQLPDGRKYQIIHVQGRFVHPFQLSRFPLDRQRLTITLENSLYPVDQLVYLPDQQQSGYAESLAVPGWQIRGFDLQSLIHDYKTNFGEPLPASGKATYSALRYQLTTERPVSYFAWKLLLPLVIVLISGWGAFLLSPKYTDSRLALPVTALLTTVFLQQSYADSIPDVGYLVLLDKIYALAYVLIILSILEAIITADWARADSENALDRIIRLDRQSLIAQSLALVGGLGLLIWL